MIKFKSIDRIFHKERIGLKPNTVRKIDLNDDIFLHLISKAYFGFNYEEIEIEIENTETKNIFKRWVEDITIWNDLMIISWKHKDDSEDLKSELGGKNEAN